MEGGTLKCILEIKYHLLPNYRIFKKQKNCGPLRSLLASGAAPLPVLRLGWKLLPGAGPSLARVRSSAHSEDWASLITLPTARCV